MMTTTSTTPRIYVASLSDYNAGHLHGCWIDLEECGFDADTVYEQIQQMLAHSSEPTAEEWAIHDHEGFSPLPVGESESMETVCQWAEAIQKHGPAIAAYLAYDPSYHTIEGFAEAYVGAYKDEATFAESWATETGGVDFDREYAQYIDFEAWGAALLDQDFLDIDNPEGGIFVFYRY